MKWEAAKLTPIQRLFCRTHFEKGAFQKQYTLDAVTAIENKNNELLPVDRMAIFMLSAFHGEDASNKDIIPFKFYDVYNNAKYVYFKI